MAHPTTHTDPAALENAARHTLAGLNMMRPRLAHAYGCPAESGGTCTCGFAELLSGAEALGAALQAEPPAEIPLEGAKKH